MKYISLAWAALWRWPVRTILTTLSLATAFLLTGLLQGLNVGFTTVISEQHLDRLVVDPRVPGGPLMPISALALIEAVPGVTHAAPRRQFLGFYQRPRNQIRALATDPKRWFAVRPEFRISAEQLEALQNTRTGIGVSRAMKERYQWELGQRIPIQSYLTRRDGSSLWEFDLVAVFDDPGNPGQNAVALINYDYLNSAALLVGDKVDRFIVRIADPNRSVGTASAIDNLFANSSNETRTRSEKELGESLLRQIGDVSFFVNAIVGTMIFSVLFLTTNTMLLSATERRSEFAVLKTIGFGNWRVFALVFAEALVLCLMAASVGLAAAAGLLVSAIFPSINGAIGPARLSWTVVAAVIAMGIFVALVSAMLPSWRLARSRIADALVER